MKSLLESFLGDNVMDSADSCRQALRQLAQQIVLLGLWRGKFFEHAAFYGGTALRMVYKLDRFSEDLDFSLLRRNTAFKLMSYFPYIVREFEAYGLEPDIRQVRKTKESTIESAFVKMETKKLSIVLEVPKSTVKFFTNNELIKIKFEIDTDPPAGFFTEAKYLFHPQPFSVKVFDEGSMFAGKLHSVFARTWKKRVKGRDWYDLVWFVSRETPARLAHFRERLIQTGHLEPDVEFDGEKALSMLRSRCEEVDYKAAAADVRPFLRDSTVLSVWSRDFFLNVISRIRFF